MIGVVQRWRIEECFQFTKDQLGLGDYEVLLDGLASPHCLSLSCTSLSVGVASIRLENSLPPPFFSPQVGWLSAWAVPGLVRPLSLAELRRWVWRLLFLLGL